LEPYAQLSTSSNSIFASVGDELASIRVTYV
jgi:hypothetical protein